MILVKGTLFTLIYDDILNALNPGIVSKDNDWTCVLDSNMHVLEINNLCENWEAWIYMFWWMLFGLQRNG